MTQTLTLTDFDAIVANLSEDAPPCEVEYLKCDQPGTWFVIPRVCNHSFYLCSLHFEMTVKQVNNMLKRNTLFCALANVPIAKIGQTFEDGFRAVRI